MTPTKEIVFFVETYKQQGKEWPVALITEALNTSDGQVCQVRVNMMKGLCNSYIRSTRDILPPLSRKDWGLNLDMTHN